MEVKSITPISGTSYEAQEAVCMPIHPTRKAWQGKDGKLTYLGPTQYREPLSKYLNGKLTEPNSLLTEENEPYTLMEIDWQRGEQVKEIAHNPLLTTLGQVKGNIADSEEAGKKGIRVEPLNNRCYSVEHAKAEAAGAEDSLIWQDVTGTIYLPYGKFSDLQVRELRQVCGEKVVLYKGKNFFCESLRPYRKMNIIIEDEQPISNQLLTTLGQVKGNIENAYNHLQAEDALNKAMATGGIAAENMVIVGQQGRAAKHAALMAIAEAMSIINHAENEHNNAGTMEGESEQEA